MAKKKNKFAKHKDSLSKKKQSYKEIVFDFDGLESLPPIKDKPAVANLKDVFNPENFRVGELDQAIQGLNNLDINNMKGQTHKEFGDKLTNKNKIVITDEQKLIKEAINSFSKLANENLKTKSNIEITNEMLKQINNFEESRKIDNKYTVNEKDVFGANNSAFKEFLNEIDGFCKKNTKTEVNSLYNKISSEIIPSLKEAVNNPNKENLNAGFNAVRIIDEVINKIQKETIENQAPIVESISDRLAELASKDFSKNKEFGDDVKYIQEIIKKGMLEVDSSELKIDKNKAFNAMIHNLSDSLKNDSKGNKSFNEAMKIIIDETKNVLKNPEDEARRTNINNAIDTLGNQSKLKLEVKPKSLSTTLKNSITEVMHKVRKATEGKKESKTKRHTTPEVQTR